LQFLTTTNCILLFFGENGQSNDKENRIPGRECDFLCFCVVVVCVKVGNGQDYLWSSSFRQAAQMFLPLNVEMSLALSQKMQAG